MNERKRENFSGKEREVEILVILFGLKCVKKRKETLKERKLLYIAYVFNLLAS